MSDNKVTMDGIKAKILAIDYTVLSGTTTTICSVTLQNGYNVIGKSACADPANFTLADGEKYALEDALEQVWPLEGYLLKQRLYEEAKQV